LDILHICTEIPLALNCLELNFELNCLHCKEKYELHDGKCYKQLLSDLNNCKKFDED